MQRLSAPTRREVDDAHKKYQWLDIGVPSVRNLLFINRWRTLGWLVLAVSSLPLHLLYNSAVFTQISATDYMAFMVDQSFITGAPFNTTDTTVHSSDTRSDDPTYHSNALQWLQHNVDSLTILYPADCVDAYAQQLQTARGDVLAVVSTTRDSSSNSLY